MRFGLAAATVAAVALASPAVFAIQSQTKVSSQHIALGDQLIVQLVATTDAGSANTVSDLRLPLPAGMTAGAPDVSPQSQVSIINGRMSQSSGVTVTWTITASKVGTFNIGPPSVTLGSEHAVGSSIQIQVVAAGAGGTPQRARRSFDPFNFMDPFGTGSPFPPGFNFPNPLDDSSAQPEQPSYPEELRLDKPTDPLCFLRATATPQHAVVGEQVTLRIVAYGAQGQFDLTDTHEPTHADFISFDGSPQTSQMYVVPLGDTRYFAAKLKELYLFPLHAGSLSAGNMTAGFTGRGYRQATPGRWPMRDSGTVEVIVTEPPLRGRPPGYKLGDVGDYKINAKVEPREVTAGESIAVVATLSGTGNVPFKLQTPEQHGVEWLEPSLAEHMEFPGGVVQGTRTFSYVVRLSEAGKVDLGELTLPFYDPKRQKYVTARGALGTINVKVNPNAKAATPDSKIDRLAGVLQPRDHLGAFAGAPKPLGDRPGFFGLLLLAPFGVVLVGGALDAASRAREKLRVRGTSLTAQLDAALREAKTLAKTDAGGAVNASERAVFLAIELKLGLKARSVLKTELPRVLAERGLPSERAAALTHILEDCDSLRFVGAASGVDPAELAVRAEATVALLLRDKPKTES